MNAFKIALFGLTLLVCFGCTSQKKGISYYRDLDAIEKPTRILMLDSGVVQEYPRTTFDKFYGTHTAFTKELHKAMQKVRPQTSNTQVIEDRADVVGLRYALRRYFGVEDNTKPGLKPIELPEKWKDLKGPFWIITDWEYQVATNVEFGGAHQAPGGSSLGIHEYGYHQITVYGVSVNSQGEVIRYASAKTKRKYIQGVKKLPLHKVMRKSLRKLGHLLEGAPAMEEKRTWPTNLYRR